VVGEDLVERLAAKPAAPTAGVEPPGGAAVRGRALRAGGPAFTPPPRGRPPVARRPGPATLPTVPEAAARRGSEKSPVASEVALRVEGERELRRGLAAGRRQARALEDRRTSTGGTGRAELELLLVEATGSRWWVQSLENATSAVHGSSPPSPGAARSALPVLVESEEQGRRLGVADGTGREHREEGARLEVVGPDGLVLLGHQPHAPARYGVSFSPRPGRGPSERRGKTAARARCRGLRGPA
jgi:hypothetical protein